MRNMSRGRRHRAGLTLVIAARLRAKIRKDGVTLENWRASPASNRICSPRSPMANVRRASTCCGKSLTPSASPSQPDRNAASRRRRDHPQDRRQCAGFDDGAFRSRALTAFGSKPRVEIMNSPSRRPSGTSQAHAPGTSENILVVRGELESSAVANRLSAPSETPSISTPMCRIPIAVSAGRSSGASGPRL